MDILMDNSSVLLLSGTSKELRMPVTLLENWMAMSKLEKLLV